MMALEIHTSTEFFSIYISIGDWIYENLNVRFFPILCDFSTPYAKVIITSYGFPLIPDLNMGQAIRYIHLVVP